MNLANTGPRGGGGIDKLATIACAGERRTGSGAARCE
jgi:hypothetical protein